MSFQALSASRHLLKAMTMAADEPRDPRFIPGAIRVVRPADDEFRQRIEAHRDSEDDGPPTQWTPEYCGERFAAAVAAGGRWYGPKAFGNAWPATLLEFSDLVDKKALEDMAAEIAKDADRREMMDEEENPKARLMHATLVEESLRWPVVYLADNPLASIALIMWAAGKAKLIRLDHYFRRMRLAHKRLRIITAYAKRASRGPRLIRRDLALWARWRELIAELSPEQQETARLDLARLANGGAHMRSRRSLDRHKRIALSRICAGLRRDNIRVR